MSSPRRSPVIRVRTENTELEPSVEIIAPSFSTDASEIKRKASPTVLRHSLPPNPESFSRSYSLHATSTSVTDKYDNRSPAVKNGEVVREQGNRLVGTYDLSSLEMNANLGVSSKKFTDVHGRRTSDTTKEMSSSSEEEMDEEDMRVTQLLARRAAHLPGNNWCQDWFQFMRNNHPLLGICFKHKLHPLGMEERLVMLVGSIAFGVSATNCVFLYYSTSEWDFDEEVITVWSVRSDKEIVITSGMVALWIFGGLVHSCFDLFIWHLSACACFLPGGFCQRFWYLQKVGSYISIALVACLVALCTFLIVIRADFEDQDGKIDFSDLNFLLGYGVELGLVYAVYWPLIGTTLFSGIFSKCIPCVGRPNDLRRQLRERLREEEERVKKEEDSKVDMF